MATVKLLRFLAVQQITTSLDIAKWLQSSCGGGKSPKQSNITVVKTLKCLQFCCDEIGDCEEEVFGALNVIDYIAWVRQNF